MEVLLKVLIPAGWQNLEVEGVGMIVDVFGPTTMWGASMPDGDILNEIMKLGDFKERFRPGDVFVIDRGFRSSVTKLTERQFVVKIPPHLVRNQKQLTTVQANQQRECTAVRWVVEMINRQLKCNRYLSRTLGVKTVPHLLADTRIAAAIHNKYGSQISAYSDDSNVATVIVNRMDQENKLKVFVDAKNLTRQQNIFPIMDGSQIPEFPEMDPIRLRTMLGSYNLKLSVAYYGDHVFGEDRYQIQVEKDDRFTSNDFEAYDIQVKRPLFIRVKLQSRHSRSKTYQAYILCDLDKSITDSVLGFYYQCLQGLRTVSLCAHVSSVIWFLGYGRFQTEIKIPSEFLNRHFPAGVPVAESDDEENE